MWITSSLTTALKPTAIALGNFDGVHRGHCRVIQPVVETVRSQLAQDQVALALSSRSFAGISVMTGEPLSSQEVAPANGSEIAPIDLGDRQPWHHGRPHATVVTFHPHPQEFFSGQSRLLLTPLDQKVTRLQTLGVEQLILLPFDQNLAALSPSEFVEQILVQQLRATFISVGANFRFGHRRSGTAEDLQAIAAGYGIEVKIVPLYTCGDDRISSSTIRQFLQAGNIASANRLLGYPYSLVGKVVQGNQLGRTLGFPTANLRISPVKFLPTQGVYSVRVTIPTLPSAPDELLGVMNLGVRPTVDGLRQVVEVHLLDWSGDLYGQTLEIRYDRFLRSEQKFPSLEALKAQIQTDCLAAKAALMGSGLPEVPAQD